MLTNTAGTQVVRQWAPFQLFKESENQNIVLLILNQPLGCWETLVCLWKKATLKIAVDGGANRLYQMCLAKKCQDEFIPDIISGDLDSALHETLVYYKNKGVEIIETPDQDAVDFTKALRVATAKLQKTNTQVSAFAALVNIGGRIDHLFGNFNVLFLARSFCEAPVYLIGDETITWLLEPGLHCLKIPPSLLKSSCGLVPLGETCLHVTTTGLKWNLDNSKLQFGSLVSTSNTFSSDSITISTDNNILFTMERVLP